MASIDGVALGDLTLRFDFNALADFEERSGVHILPAIQEGHVSFTHVRTILFVTARKADGTKAFPTREAAGEYAQKHPGDSFAAALRVASRAFASPDASDAEPSGE